LRAQAAMEYLTTYAWAIMALVVVMGGIAYFGFGSINDYIPQSCTVNEPFICEDFLIQEFTSGVSAPEVAFDLRNTADEMYSVSKMNITYDDTTGNQHCGRIRNLENDELLQPNEFYEAEPNVVFAVECNPGGGSTLTIPEGEKVKVDFEFVYKKGVDGFPRVGKGSIIGNVQKQ